MDEMTTVNKVKIPENKREYTVIESLYAWLSVIFGYLFCKVSPLWVNPLGGCLFLILIYVTTTIVLKKAKAEFGGSAIATAVSGVFMGVSLIFTSDVMLQLLAYAYAIIAYCYYVFVSLGNATKKGFNDFIVADYMKALFVAPVRGKASVYAAIFTGKAKKSGDTLRRGILGIAIAFIPTIIVANLLSFDDGFTNILESIFDFDSFNVFSELFCIGIGIFVGMYLFNLFIVSKDKACKEYSELDCQVKMRAVKIVHAATTIVAVLPILFLYVVFFVSQWKYYMYGFSGKLPEGFSYATYAREGFFQLMAVAVINLIIIITVLLFMKQDKEWSKPVRNIIVVTYSVVTLVLIATAIAKMIMYIDCYGLTHKRVYSTWLMIVLAIIFVIIIVNQFVKKISGVSLSVWTFIVMFAVLAISNIDGLIAKYNIDRYLAGSLDSVDLWVMEDLQEAAVPELVRLAKKLETRINEEGDNSSLQQEILYDKVINRLTERATEYENEERGIMGYTIPYYRAVSALRDIELMDN